MAERPSLTSTSPKGSGSSATMNNKISDSQNAGGSNADGKTVSPKDEVDVPTGRDAQVPDGCAAVNNNEAGQAEGSNDNVVASKVKFEQTVDIGDWYSITIHDDTSPMGEEGKSEQGTSSKVQDSSENKMTDDKISIPLDSNVNKNNVCSQSDTHTNDIKNNEAATASSKEFKKNNLSKAGKSSEEKKDNEAGSSKDADLKEVDSTKKENDESPDRDPTIDAELVKTWMRARVDLPEDPENPTRRGRQRLRKSYSEGRRSSDGDIVYLAEENGREVRVICRCGAGERLLRRIAHHSGGFALGVNIGVGGISSTVSPASLRPRATSAGACDRRIVMVHLLIEDEPQTIVFCRDLPQDMFREMLLGACGGYPCDNLRLCNSAGNIVPPTPDLPTNTPSTAYIVTIFPQSCDDGEAAQGEAQAAGTTPTAAEPDAKTSSNAQESPPAVAIASTSTNDNGAANSTRADAAAPAESKKVDKSVPGSAHKCLRRCHRPPIHTMSSEHIACLGGRILDTRRPSEPHHHVVWQHFLRVSEEPIPRPVRDVLLTLAFDSYACTDEKIIYLMMQMFIDLGLVNEFPIDLPVLKNFLYEVYKHYNEVPFHNFRHCFCVAQTMFAMCMKAKLTGLIGEMNVLILLVSCICHDLDHPGFNNIYQINARTELALRYNDISPLENHHCSVAFRILQIHECNIFRNFSVNIVRQLREGIIRCILATDMARHNEILAQFVDTAGTQISASNTAHVNLLCMVLIKVADISNEVRPLNIAEPWLDRLLQEFFAQSDLEKRLGLPVTPFMDRDKVTKPSSQCAFIGLVLLPLFEALAVQLPCLEDILVHPAKAALEHYRRINEHNIKQRSMSTDTDASTAPGGSMTARCSISSAGDAATQEGNQHHDNQVPSCSNAFDSMSADLNDMAQENEADVSEKALKFKITTEGSIERRSYPPSRKVSLH